MNSSGRLVHDKGGAMPLNYSGFYARFEAPDKKLGGLLTGADTLVGDEFEVFFKQEEE